MLLIVFLTKSRASEYVLLDFQLPAIILLFLENSCLRREVLNIRYLNWICQYKLEQNYSTRTLAINVSSIEKT